MVRYVYIVSKSCMLIHNRGTTVLNPIKSRFEVAINVYDNQSNLSHFSENLYNSTFEGVLNKAF